MEAPCRCREAGISFDHAGCRDSGHEENSGIGCRGGDQRLHEAGRPWRRPRLPCSDRLPIFAYLRLLAPLILDGVEGFLYLDSDVLVRANVEDLRRNVQQGWTVAAAPDYFHRTLGHGLPQIFGPELDGSRPYFNSGVMWVKADFWRREKITEQCLEYLATEGREVQHGDQDALNAVFAGSFAPLDASWNMQAGAIDYFDRTEWPASQEDLLSRRSELLGGCCRLFISAGLPSRGMMASGRLMLLSIGRRSSNPAGCVQG